MADEFEKIKLIGEGSFGKAWLSKCKKTNSDRAIKQIKLDKLSPQQTELALTEVTVLSRCRHPNIISYFQAFVEDGSLNIVMEFAKYGDLHNMLEKQDVHLDKEVILGWFTQICFALKFLHKQNILHRDLKSQNIFMCGSNLLKLGDFGIARLLESECELAMTTIGTPLYFSPEICNKQPYNHKSDIWAVGCVLYEMCCFHVPFMAQNYMHLMMKITQSQYEPVSKLFGPLIEDLIKILLKPDPEDRPSCDELLAIPAMQPHVDAYLHKQRTLSEKRHSMTSPTIISGMIKKRCTPMAKPPNRDQNDNAKPEHQSPESSEKDTPTKLGLIHTKQIQRLNEIGISSPKSTRPLNKGLTPLIAGMKVKTGMTPLPKMSLLKEMHKKAHMTSGLPPHVYTTAGTPAVRRASVPALHPQRKSSIALSISSMHRASSSSNAPLSIHRPVLPSESSTGDQTINSSISDSSGVFLTDDDIANESGHLGAICQIITEDGHEDDSDESDESDVSSSLGSEDDEFMRKFDRIERNAKRRGSQLEVPVNEIEMKSDGDEDEKLEITGDSRLDVVDEEAEFGSLDMNNNQADMELQEVDHDLNEIFELFYESALCMKENPQKCTDVLQGFLEEKYGFERFFRIQNKIKESVDQGIPAEKLSMDMTSIEKLYMPMMFHLITLENIELKIRGLHISSDSS